MPKSKKPIIALHLDEIELSELIMVVGSFIFAGNKLTEIDDEVLVRVNELLDIELNERLTGIPEYETLH